MGAPNSCQPCNCIPSNVGVAYFYSALLNAVCQLVNGGTEAVTLPLVTKAFGFFTNAYQALGFLDSAESLKYAKINNQTDGDLVISVNGTDDFWVVKAWTVEELPFGENGSPLSADDLYVKYSTAPTVGNLYVQGFY